MSNERLTLAVGIDIARMFDATVTQAQIDADTLLNSGDDDDTLASMIEDAENEFRQVTDVKFSIGRKGLTGRRETYENVTYDLSGHQNYKRAWTGTTGNYLPQEVSTSLDGKRILPFDPDAGDEIYFYRGLGGKGVTGGEAWEDITDEVGETWAIKNHRSGRITFDPMLLYETYLTGTQGVGLGGRGQLRELTVAISYRYGGLGGSSDWATATELDVAIDDQQTGTVAVVDGGGFPSDGTKIVLIDREYVEVSPDPANDEMEILTRGVRGTTPASHDTGSRVQYTPPAIRKAVAARAGMQLVASNRYRGYLPDTEDDLDSGDVVDEFEAVWQTTVDALSE